jgi:hypothetical protein
MQAAWVAVRDKWIAEGRYEDLARAILANWTSGNCVAFMTPLTAALIDAGAFELHRHLWARTIRRQVDTFFAVLGREERPKPAYLRLLNADTTGFNENDPTAYHDATRAAAFLLQRLSCDLQRWRDELRGAGRDAREPEAIACSLQRLERPVIRIPRATPAWPYVPPGGA